MNGWIIFMLIVSGLIVCLTIGLAIRNWSRRSRFFSEFGVSSNSEYDVVKRAIFLRLKERTNLKETYEKELANLRRDIDQLMSTSDLEKRQKEIDNFQKSYWVVSAQIEKARNLAYLCLPAGGHDPKFLFESVDWSLEHNNSPLTSL